MKKLSYVLVAAAVVMSAASCEKISDLVNGVTENEQGLVDDKGKDLTPDQQKVKIEETANTLMDLMDKKGWEAEYNKVNETIDALSAQDVDAEDIGTYLSDIVSAWTSIRGENPNEVSSSISAVSAESAISALLLSAEMDGAGESAEWLFADFAEVADIADLVTRLIPASLAFWKKDLMVTPVPWARRHLSYCLSHSDSL